MPGLSVEAAQSPETNNIVLFEEKSAISTSADCGDLPPDPRKVFYIIDNQNREMPFVVKRPEVVFAAQHQESAVEDSVLIKALHSSVNFKVMDHLNSDQNIALSLQKANDDPIEAHTKIRAYQATLRLKRTCGVSYVKQPESRQIGAAPTVAPIPPLVIQCSAMIDPWPHSHPEFENIQDLCTKYFSISGPILASYEPAIHETDFRLRLLEQLNEIEKQVIGQVPHEIEGQSGIANSKIDNKHSKWVSVKDLEDFGLLIHPNTYLSILLPIPAELNISLPYLILGIHTKRSISSKSAYLDRIKMQPPLQSGSNQNPSSLLSSLLPMIQSKLATLPPVTSSTFQDAVDTTARNLYSTCNESFLSFLEMEPAQPTPPIDNLNLKLNKLNTPVSSSPSTKFLQRVLAPPGHNLHTVALKVECFVPEAVWRSLNSHQRKTLTTFAHVFKGILDSKLLAWSLKRQDCEGLQNVQVLSQATQLLPPIWGQPFDNPEKNFEEGFESLLPSGWKPALTVPLYTVDTRDSFAFDPIIQAEYVTLRGRQVLKKTYFFDSAQLPSNYGQFITRNPQLASSPRVGVVTYEGLYSEEELQKIEAETLETEKAYLRAEFLPHTGQALLSGHKLKRTKFFFGSRYLWTANQLAHPHSKVASGIRTDVSPVPLWMKQLVENPMVEAGILEHGFVNSVALNVYHDGEEGLGQHFDDAIRFRQPIFSLRVFSDARLAFGSQLYNFCNGAFCIPMSRGTVTILEEDSFAANGLKHCIRPVDMAGKSAAFILRQMHPQAVADAKLYDWYVDLPHKLHTLSIEGKCSEQLE